MIALFWPLGGAPLNVAAISAFWGWGLFFFFLLLLDCGYFGGLASGTGETPKTEGRPAMGAFRAGGYPKKGTFAGGWGLLARVSKFQRVASGGHVWGAMLGGGGWWPPFFLPLTCGADSFFFGGLGAFRWGRFIFPYTPWLGGADRDGGRGGGFAGAARGD